MKTILKNASVVNPFGPVITTDITIDNGIIADVGKADDADAKVYDCDGLQVLPGVIDAHTHIGYGSERDMETETQSAIAGGVTTLLTYHRKNENYLETVPKFIDKINAESYCNVGVQLGLSNPDHIAELEIYADKFGIPSFKYFTNYTGAAGVKAGVSITSDAYLLEIMTKLAKINGVICIHTENQDLVESYTAKVKAKGEDSLKGWYEARPPYCEADALMRVAYCAVKTGCTLYVVHVTCKESLDMLNMIRKTYPEAKIIAETCPHYLTHTFESSLGNVGKVNPPLRTKSDIDALWAAIEDGRIATIASDHVARKLEKKTGSIFTINAGFPGSGTLLPIMLHEGVYKRGIKLQRIAEMMSYNPAKIFGIPNRGYIAPGMAADLTVVDTRKVDKVKVEFSNADYSIFDGWELTGWPVYTFIDGQERRAPLYAGELNQPCGKYIARKL